MPRVEHVGLWVADLDIEAAFYERFLGGTPGARYHNPTTGFTSVFLTWDDGARLELMTRPGLADRPVSVGYGYAHVAFGLGSQAAVDDLTAALRDAGYAVVGGPRRTGDGYYEAEVCDPEGNRVELSADI